MNASCHGSYTVHNSNQVIYSCFNANCHGNATWGRKDLSNKSTLNNSNVNIAKSLYSIQNGSNATLNQTFHNPDSTIPCLVCHGPMHNISKPNASTPRNTDTESEQCTACHKSYNMHNNTVNCTLCHSDDVHDIQVFAQNATFVDLNHDNPNPARGNCTNCHQNGSFINLLKWNQTTNPRGGNYTGNPPDIIPNPLKHSSSLSNGSIWGTYWNQTALSSSSCYYCHNNTKHNSTAMGNVGVLLSSTNIRNGTSLTTSDWCADCHYNNTANANYKGSLWNPAPPLVTVDNTGKTGWTDHSGYFGGGYNDSICKSCHALLGPYLSTSLNFSHSLDVGSSGGPNCLTCHNLVTGLSGGAPVGINFTTANTSVHFGTNSNNATSQGYAPVIGACWACHDNDGNVSSGHPDRYKNPKTCTECHLGTGTYNTSAYNAIIVSEHYYAGINITAGNSASSMASCINCHENVSEMILYNNDTDTGSFAGDGVRLTGGNMSFYHYGKDRSDLRSWNSSQAANCSYCHQNTSTAFAIGMKNPGYNSSIQNHSQSNSPGCFNTTCHASGWIHNLTLNKPVLNSTNAITFCSTCHANKQKHNNTQDCSNCHIDQASQDTIHPIKYIQRTGGFASTSTLAANCTDCHQKKLSGFSTAPIIPNPLKHSSNASNGTIWGTYWSWSQTSSSPCYYCHTNTKHNNTALGSISNLLSLNNVKNGSSLATSDWCADCHYNDTANANYKGSLWNPAPPLITVDNTGKGGWTPHNSYLTAGYNDSICKSCHALNGTSYITTSLNYSHSLDPGAGGAPNCLTCHNLVTGLSGGAPTGINFTAANASVHFGMNSNNATAQGYAPVVGACWACHDTDGNVTSGHPDKKATPKNCTECHLSSGTYYSQSAGWGGLTVNEHYYGADQIRAGNSTSAIESCINCHENVSEMILYNNDTDTASSFTGDGVRLVGGNMSSYHYGSNRSLQLRTRDAGKAANCSYCHQNASTAFNKAMVNAGNRSIANHSINYAGSNPYCIASQCHGSGWIHNTTLTKPGLTPLPNSTYCLSCHGSNGAGGTNYSGSVTGIKEKHNGSVNCTLCHLNTSRSIHPVRYLQAGGSTWDTAKTGAVNCTSCHLSILDANFSKAPVIPNPLRHSTNVSNGTIWGTYWNSTRASSSPCYYCHSNTTHNNTALGKINDLRLVDANNTKNGSLTITTWCADCHYNDTANTKYIGSQWDPDPPVITKNNTGRSNWENHSGYLGGGYRDSNCLTCHGLNGTYVQTSLNYSHSLDVGINGGPDCIACHDIGGSAGAGRYVNFTAANSTNASHRNLNNITDAGGLSPQNRKCWGCHQSDGTKPSGHPDLKDNTIMTGGIKAYRCEDCHITGGNASTYQPSNYQNATKVYMHYPGSYFKGLIMHSMNFTEGSCQVCHNRSLIPSNVAADINATVSHYADTYNLWNTSTSMSCGNCHNGASPYGVPRQLVNAQLHSMNIACQASCHNPFYLNTSNVNPVNLHNTSVSIYYGYCYVGDCHSRPGR